MCVYVWEKEVPINQNRDFNTLIYDGSVVFVPKVRDTTEPLILKISAIQIMTLVVFRHS